MSACDNAIKHGVFPVPPAVIPPTTITGTRASIGWAFGAVTRRLTHTTDQTIGKTGKNISLVDSDSVALNLSATSGVSEFTSGRVTSFNYSSNLAANDILINGENALAATLTSNLTSGNNTATALETAINANSFNHGAVATGFNSLTSSVISNLSMSDTFTINSNTISIQTSLANLITEINQEASGVTAVLN